MSNVFVSVRCLKLFWLLMLLRRLVYELAESTVDSNELVTPFGHGVPWPFLFGRMHGMSRSRRAC